MHHDPHEQGQAWLEVLPDPAREDLAGRVFKARDVVEIVVVELVVQRRERGFDVRKVHHPAQFRVKRAAHVHVHCKGVPMQARAFVPDRNVGQSVRGFDAECLGNIHRGDFNASAA